MKNKEKKSQSEREEEEERSDGDTGWVEEKEKEKEEKACSRCASMPTLHTHIFTHTVQAADINNSLLIFICSGEM